MKKLLKSLILFFAVIAGPVSVGAEEDTENSIDRLLEPGEIPGEDGEWASREEIAAWLSDTMKLQHLGLCYSPEECMTAAQSIEFSEDATEIIVSTKLLWNSEHYTNVVQKASLYDLRVEISLASASRDDAGDVDVWRLILECEISQCVTSEHSDYMSEIETGIEKSDLSDISIYVSRAMWQGVYRGLFRLILLLKHGNESGEHSGNGG